MRGGQGGAGSASFRREPFVPRGGPDGGDGGRGGSVILLASHDVADLARYASHIHWKAGPGADGAGGRKTGRHGDDLTLVVPVGTQAADTGGAVIADLVRAGDRAVVALGGAGGRGNVHFKSPSRQAPDFAERGLKGDELTITLDLKLIADVGLVGPPNAGKSSLLRALTAARPKVADYPFTTLDPQLGVADSSGGRVVIADIPGLIEGASKGLGLGLRFLRHIERTRLLVYVLDGASPDSRKQLAALRRELAQYSPRLARRPSVVAINKVDLDAVKRLRARTRRANVLFVSALSGEGLPALMQAIVSKLAGVPEPARTGPVRTELVPALLRRRISVEKLPTGFLVRGEPIERLVQRTDLDSDTALTRFQAELDRLGVNAALESAGVMPGDSVRVADVEFEYQP